jgi:hypothetical protein
VVIFVALASVGRFGFNGPMLGEERDRKADVMLARAEEQGVCICGFRGSGLVEL